MKGSFECGHVGHTVTATRYVLQNCTPVQVQAGAHRTVGSELSAMSMALTARPGRSNLAGPRWPCPSARSGSAKWVGAPTSDSRSSSVVASGRRLVARRSASAFFFYYSHFSQDERSRAPKKGPYTRKTGSESWDGSRPPAFVAPNQARQSNQVPHPTVTAASASPDVGAPRRQPTSARARAPVSALGASRPGRVESQIQGRRSQNHGRS